MEGLRRSLMVFIAVVLVGCNPLIRAALLGGNGSSGIEGQVLIGPTCPVMRAEDPSCADKPYPATLLGLYQNGQLLARLVTDDQGRFKVSLEPGTYILVPERKTGQLARPRQTEQEVVVKAGAYTQVRVIYDSGIR